jgi:hypothetical protein
MSEAYYSKKFKITGLTFKKTGFSQDEKELKDFVEQKTYDSWKIFSNSKIFKKKSMNRNYGKILLQKEKANYLKNNKIFNFRFNRAPTLKENQNEINKIIKKKKLKRKEELSNIHNTILINESKSFRKGLYVTASELIFEKKKKNKSSMNRSCDEISFKKDSLHKSINNSSVENNTTNFNRTGFNFNSSYKKLFVNNENTSFNKSILFREANNDKSRLLPSLSSYKNKNKNKKYNQISKTQIQMNDIIFNEFKSVQEFSDMEKKMAKFKIAQNVQMKKLNEIKSKNKFTINDKINMIINLKIKLEHNYKIFSNEMDDYIYYLKDKLFEISTDLQSIDKEIFSKSIELEKIIFKIVKKQSELQFLIEIRNFLQKVKDKREKKEKPPLYYYKLLIQESNKLFIGNYLLNLKIINQITNKKVVSFINSVLKTKEIIEERKIDDIYCNNYYTKREEIKPIFNSVDEFINVNKLFMEKNLYNLQEFQSTKKEISKLRKEYIEIEDTTYLLEEIKEKKEIKERLIQKNELLKQRYIYYIEQIKKIGTEIKINPKNKGKDVPLYLDYEIDLEQYHREKYIKKLKKLKFNGILLLGKLKNVVKNFFKSEYATKEFYKNFFNKERDKLEVLEISDMKFDENNIKLIDGFILKIISIYEDICKFVVGKHYEYMSNKKNSEFLKKRLEEIELKKRIKNLYEQKRIEIIKNNEEKKKIIEKSIKSIIYISKMKKDNNQLKKNKILKIKSEKKFVNFQKNFLENEFNSLIKYNEDDII